MNNADGTIFISGGSSGIGLATAIAYARVHKTARLALFARNQERLDRAAVTIRAEVSGAEVHCFALDVANAEHVASIISQAVAALGAPDRVVLAAGVTLPGRHDANSLAAQREVMEINYFGSLNMVLALAPLMRAGSRLALVGSAAGLIGTYGYGGYAPSKFALRGLAEVLRVELATRGISVTLCLPPDTDTPMLAGELGLRPAVTNRIAAGAPVLSAGVVASALVRGMEAGRFLVLPGLPVKLLYLFGPWIAPIARWQQRRLIRMLGE